MSRESITTNAARDKGQTWLYTISFNGRTIGTNDVREAMILAERNNTTFIRRK